MTLIKRISIVVFASLLVCSTLFLTAFKPVSDLFEISKNIDIFTSVYKELNTYYVDDIDPNKVMRTGIDAMLESLDPYTNYISEAEMEGYKFQVTGNYGGIGATIRPIDDRLTITDVFEGFPAEKSGLKAGDLLLSVDGFDVSEINNEISELLRGSPGSKVLLKIFRPYLDQEIELEVVREEVNLGNVPYYGMVNDKIGYIILSQFTDNAGRNVENAFLELKEENPELAGIILDVRGNPGGLLREAVNISNIFIDKGKEVVSTRSRIAEWDKTFLSINPAVDTEIPLAILTSRSSASASEIVAGVIQDYDRGVIIGQKSFGKGLVQTTRDISYKTKLKLTTAKYYIPSGRCVQAINYAQRNEDGSVGKIPDSLKVAFTTNSGRTVYDGGGIDPDILTEENNYNKITLSLLRGNHIFNYVTQYVAERTDSIESRGFSLSDEEYNSFVEYLSDKDYDYTTETELVLDDLEATAEKEKRSEAMGKEIASLREKIAADKQKDLMKFKDEILYELNREIAGRYHYFSGRVESSFDKDPDIQSAINILLDREAYNNILTSQN